MKVTSTINPDDLKRFGTWRSSLIKRVEESVLDCRFATQVIRHLRDPWKNEPLLADIQDWVADEILRKDLILTIIVLDGTVKLSKVAEDGKPS